jgi:hypothetical protein
MLCAGMNPSAVTIGEYRRGTIRNIGGGQAPTLQDNPLPYWVYKADLRRLKTRYVRKAIL